MPETVDWKSERIQAVKESIEFFHNTNKLEREKWVVARLLENFRPDFSEGSLHEAEEPADVQFEDASFQVKEVLEHDRRRGDEYNKALEKAETAEEYGDLLEDYTPYNISFEEIVNRCYEYSKELTRKYGPKERENLDFICYFNYLDSNEVPPVEVSFSEKHYRSFSVISNRYRSVIYTAEGASEFLKQQVGIVFDILGK
ncbi:MAG: DUF1780 domain-containing protein [Candidatus Thiodiazotropha lotti]|uniref:DUF1780 domain-containing protein n=1 Tax=Candidatus Thiodiazotropha lotti TaxID=2792787 RepID=A0A9E4K3S4_9GAMM|nr:DUF1780 domain-containing protein [Candidatus Thiodiazotropha lotti]MCW4203362.1 DUF1780 domain-containing protein [Candidatus Thiodiazotropha lotti]